jgi:uncharacterized protein YndB with AHSA1/START domain
MNALQLTVPDGVPFIDYERPFDFPAAEVFRAHADPGLVARWLGPRGTHVDIAHYDFRSGGSYLYRHTGSDGASYAFSGVFHTVREDEAIIRTFEFSGHPDVVSIEFLSFEDLDRGRSLLRAHCVYTSQQARDGMAASGMEQGVAEGYERLEELLVRANAAR